MNVDEIKENYPLSWELFLRYSGLKTAMYSFDDPKWYRQLFDFFDQNEIAVEIGVDLTLEAKYCFRVSQLNDGEWINSGNFWSDLFYTRREAEDRAFETAFILFERQLKE